MVVRGKGGRRTDDADYRLMPPKRARGWMNESPGSSRYSNPHIRQHAHKYQPVRLHTSLHLTSLVHATKRSHLYT